MVQQEIIVTQPKLKWESVHKVNILVCDFCWNKIVLRSVVFLRSQSAYTPHPKPSYGTLMQTTKLAFERCNFILILQICIKVYAHTNTVTVTTERGTVSKQSEKVPSFRINAYVTARVSHDNTLDIFIFF